MKLRQTLAKLMVSGLALVLGGGLFFHSIPAPAASLKAGFLATVAKVDSWLVGRGSAKAVFSATPGAAPAGRAGLPIPMIMGYYYDPGGDSSQAVADLRHYRDLLTGLVPFWYTIYADGNVTGGADPRVLQFARAYHMYVFALFQNMAGSAVFHPLLNDPAASRNAVAQILAVVRENGYDGVNLDFEGIAPGDREAFTAFCGKLGTVLHRYGYYLTLSIPAETRDNPYNSWSGAYDYAALGKVADLIMPMAYDQHSRDSAPGPIASQSWVQKVTAFAVSQVPPSKLVLGIPAYGYSWAPFGVAKALSYWQAVDLARAYGANPSADHLEYFQGGVWHQVWYENEGTFLQKVGVVNDYNLRGIVLWRLGIEDPRIWQTIRPL